MKTENFYLGLDIGTNSIGYAVTDTQYFPIKCHGEPMWGTHLFEEASFAEDRRMARVSRRRIARRKYRTRSGWG